MSVIFCQIWQFFWHVVRCHGLGVPKPLILLNKDAREGQARFLRCSERTMNLQDRTLVRKLTTVLVIKLVVLVALWWGFVRDQRVPVDVDAAASQMLGDRPAPASTTQE